MLNSIHKYKIAITIIIILALATAITTTKSATAQNNSGIKIANLEAIDISAIGNINENEGGLPQNIWENTNAELIVTAIKILPDNYKYPEATKLAKQMLITAAPLTQYKNNKNQKQISRQFIITKINKLRNMGLYQDALNLINQIPGRYFDDQFEQLATNTLINNGNIKEACANLPPDKNIPKSNNFFWHHLIMLCSLNEGKIEEVEFMLNVLTNEKIYSEQFVELINNAINQNNKNSIINIQKSKNNPHNAIINAIQDFTTQPKFNTKIATNTQLQRLKIIHKNNPQKLATILLKLNKNNIISTQILKNFYNSYKFNENRFLKITQKNNIQNTNQTDYPLFFQAIKSHKLLSAKAQIITQFLKSANHNNDLNAIIPLIKNEINSIPELKELKQFANTFAIAQLYNQNFESAQKWNSINKNNQNSYKLLAKITQQNTENINITKIYPKNQILKFPPQLLILADKIIQNQTKPSKPSKPSEPSEEITEKTTAKTTASKTPTLEEINQTNNEILTPQIWQELLAEHPNNQQLPQEIIKKHLQTKQNAQAILTLLQHADDAQNSSDALYNYLKIWQKINPNLAHTFLLNQYLQEGFMFPDEA